MVTTVADKACSHAEMGNQQPSPKRAWCVQNGSPWVTQDTPSMHGCSSQTKWGWVIDLTMA